MVRRLTLDRLLAVCDGEPEPARAEEAVEALGWLSPWWLRPDVIDAACQEQPVYAAYRRQPSLPYQPGGCWALLVNPRRLKLLRDAFVLPLLWRESDSDDSCLPSSLRDLAGQVRRQLGDGFTNWRLSLPKPRDEDAIDLSPLDDGAFRASSAWASLAGGLLLAHEGLTPDTTVWASAAWDEAYGIGRVEGLQVKLEHAAERGAKHMFVPAQNQPDVAEWAAGRPDGPLVTLLSPAVSAGTPDPRRILEPYLSELGVEPGAEQAEDAKERYYNLVDRRKANDFYWRVLLDSVVEERRRLLPADCKPTHLVAVVGNEPSSVAITPLVLDVQRCLLLHTEPLTKPVEQALAKVESRLGIEKAMRKPIRGRSRAEEVDEIKSHLACFATGVQPEYLAFDLTPGYKSLMLAVLEAAPPGAWLLYCRHELTDRVVFKAPGEQYDCWRK
jgi:hypothetical protein